MHAFYSSSYYENVIKQCDPTVNMLNIVQYVVLNQLFSKTTFLIKLSKNFDEQVEGFFNVTSDSSVKKIGYPA